MTKYAIATMGTIQPRMVLVKVRQAKEVMKRISAWTPAIPVIKLDVLEIVDDIKTDEGSYKGTKFRPGTLILEAIRNSVVEFEDDDTARLWFELNKNDFSES